MSDKKYNISFLAVGPQRTGTTWVYEMLKRHPNICTPKSVKETMFFDKRYDRGIEWYSKYFNQKKSGQVRGEVAPTYFDVEEVPERVVKVSPECEIIVGLRHPAERAFSLYIHHLRKGRVPSEFWKAIDQKPRIITAGHYAEHLPRWKSIFGEKQLHYLFLSDIRDRPHVALRRTCDWIEVDWKRDWFPQMDRSVNTSSVPRFPLLAKLSANLTRTLHKYGLHEIVKFGKKAGIKKLIYSKSNDKIPKLSEEDRKKLIEIYERDVSMVESITGRCLDSWRK